MMENLLSRAPSFHPLCSCCVLLLQCGMRRIHRTSSLRVVEIDIERSCQSANRNVSPVSSLKWTFMLLNNSWSRSSLHVPLWGWTVVKIRSPPRVPGFYLSWKDARFKLFHHFLLCVFFFMCFFSTLEKLDRQAEKLFSDPSLIEHFYRSARASSTKIHLSTNPLSCQLS